jgi:hypothetical protein
MQWKLGNTRQIGFGRSKSHEDRVALANLALLGKKYAALLSYRL